MKRVYIAGIIICFTLQLTFAMNMPAIVNDMKLSIVDDHPFINGVMTTCIVFLVAKNLFFIYPAKTQVYNQQKNWLKFGLHQIMTQPSALTPLLVALGLSISRSTGLIK